MAGVPLSERVPIVDKSGFASPYLVRFMQGIGGGASLPSQSGNAGKVLSTNGATLSWITVGGTGTVTNVGTSGTVNGLTLTGGPITGSGTVTLGGTLSGVDLGTQTTGGLPVARGGVPTGGTTGQALVKSSNTDYDVAWAAGTAGGDAISWAI